MTEQDKIEFLNYAIANAQDLKGLPAASSSDAIESVVAKTSVGDMKLLPYSNLKVAADSALSATSANPVQNKAVKAALDGKQAKLTAGSGIIINGSEISTTYKIWHGSQAEYDAIAAKDDMTIYLIEES